jgi:para-nitrobenzyl esterase
VIVDPHAAYRADRFTRVPMVVGATDADIGGKTGYMVGGARAVAGMLADKARAGLGISLFLCRLVGRPAGCAACDRHPFFFDNQAIGYGAATTPRRPGDGLGDERLSRQFREDRRPHGAGLPRWDR